MLNAENPNLSFSSIEYNKDKWNISAGFQRRHVFEHFEFLSRFGVNADVLNKSRALKKADIRLQFGYQFTHDFGVNSFLVGASLVDEYYPVPAIYNRKSLSFVATYDGWFELSDDHKIGAYAQFHGLGSRTDLNLTSHYKYEWSEEKQPLLGFEARVSFAPHSITTKRLGIHATNLEVLGYNFKLSTGFVFEKGQPTTPYYGFTTYSRF